MTQSATQYPRFQEVTYPEPHNERTRKIVKAHPEVRQLMGNTPSSALWILAAVITQTALAAWLSQSPWWAILGVGFVVGATINHAMFVMIHEATHNLVFKGSSANKLAGILANLPIVFPSAIGFRNYHLLHHRYQGEMGWDADLASPWEARLVGRSAIMKTLWMLLFFVIEGVVRPIRVAKVPLLERWTMLNLAVEVAFLAGVTALFGWGALAYLAVSTVFSIGLHPMGARWIQEHYLVKERAPGQETFSYYGPLNALMFNVGHHNEHHDLMMIPWSRLPRLKAMAPEFYDSLYAHRSYCGLLWRFIFDRDLTLYSRAIRPDHAMSKAEAREAALVQQEFSSSTAHATV